MAWGGLVGPAGTPRSIIDQLNATLNRALQQPELKPRLDAMAWEVQVGAPRLLADLARQEAPRWADVVRRSGASLY